MTGSDIAAEVARYVSGGTLRLTTPNDLGSPTLDALLATFFGGTLTAAVGEPAVQTASVVYSDASMATSGFGLYTKAAVTATITFYAREDDSLQVTVAARMPDGYGLGDSFPALIAQSSPLAGLALTGATLTLDSTFPAGQVDVSAGVDPSRGALEPLGWLFLSVPQLTGEIAVTGAGTATAAFTGELTSPLTDTPDIGGFGLRAGLRVSGFPAPPSMELDAPVVWGAEVVVDLVTPSITVPVSIALRGQSSAFDVTFDLVRPAPQLTGLSQVSGFTSAAGDPSHLISSDTPIGDLSLDWLSFVLDADARQIRDVQVRVRLGTDWTPFAGFPKLESLVAAFTIPQPLDPQALSGSQSPISVTLTAEIGVGSATVDAYVAYPQKVIGLTLAPGPPIDVGELMTKFAGGASLPGRADVEIVRLDAIADIGASSYSVSAQAAGRLTVIEGFVLEELDFAIAYANGSLTDLGFGCIFSIAGTELYLAAARGTGGWLLSGGTYQDSSIDLAALITDIARIFGVTLPSTLPKITLSDLQLGPYDTSTGSFTFAAAVAVMTDDALFEGITGRVTISHDPSTGQGAWTGDVAGNLLLSSSTLTVAYDFHTSQTIALGWVASGTETFGIADLCTKLGISPPPIPEGLDLGLTSFHATYDVTDGWLLLGTTSVHYGNAAFFSERLDATKRLYAFGVEIPLNVTLADIPLVGDKLPEADQLGITDAGGWFLSQPLTKQQVEAVNARVASLGKGYPQLPDQDLDATAVLLGTFLLGSTKVPLALPLGGGRQSAAPAPPAPGSANGDAAPGPANGDAASATPPGPPAPAAPTAPAPPPADGTRWFSIQRSFGVFYLDRIGVAYGDGNELTFSLDASIQLGPLTFSMLGLSISSPLETFDPSFRLSGLGLSYVQGPLQISGAFYAVPSKQLSPDLTFEYDGVAVIKTGEFGLGAVGSYAQETSGDPSLFVFAQLELPLGGPPAFFVTGLMAGFGYNRSLTLPAQDEVMGFPLLTLGTPPAPGQPAATQDPAHVLEVLEGRQPATPGGKAKAWIAPRTGEYWFAVGLEFTSFELVDTRALLVAQLGDQLTVALIGLSTLRLPQGASNDQTYAYLQLQLEAVLQPEEGFFGLTAVLSSNSYVLAPQCHLTGGFAFYLWFGDNENAGQFVVTVGGYHPAFSPPPYFPKEPRLGFAWAVSDDVTIKGEAYFALTTSCAMAGGGLSVTYQSGDLRAWFTAQADVLVAWHPFHFRADIGISIGVSYKLDLGLVSKTLSVSVGASVALWGPPTGGTVTVDLWFVSFTVAFGAAESEAANEPLDWPGFSALLPAAVCTMTASDGIKAMQDDDTAPGGKMWIVRAGSFAFATEAAIPSTKIVYDGPDGTAHDDDAGFSFSVRPMDVTAASATHTVGIVSLEDQTAVDLTTWPASRRTRTIPESLWGAPLVDADGNFTQVPRHATANVIEDAPVGARIQVPPPQLGATPGAMPVSQMYEPVAAPGVAAVDAAAPLDPAIAASSVYVPGFDDATIAAIAGIDTGDALANRNATFDVLSQACVYRGPSDAMSELAESAAELFADAPLSVA